MSVEQNRLTQVRAVVCLLTLAGVLASCNGAQDGAGGAGGDGGGLAGIFVGGPISGVSFETDTRSGVTAEDGSFRYEAGETVRFFIGDTVLGEAPAQPEISPFDLIPDAEPLRGTDATQRALSNRCNPFVSVINMATLLQTLDRDNDLANGIDVTSEIRTLFDGVSIDFAQSQFSFGRDADLRGVLSRANEVELFEDHRQVRSGAFAAQDLYASLGLDAGLFVVTHFERDDGADETIDFASESSFDERGQLLFSSQDDDADGDPDSSTRIEYDEYGHQVLFEFDNDGNSMPDVITQNVFNDDGDQIRRERDDDGDGDVDAVTVTSYDDIGRRLRTEEDQNNNGTVDRIITYWYDDEARQGGSREDEDGDGIIDQSETNFFDENGNLIRRQTDEGDDGTINSLTVFTLDARGNVTRSERDRDGDGELDDIDVYEYDARCLRTFHEEQEGDGTISRTTTTVYDEAGRELSRAVDSNADGMPDSIDTNEYDESGNLIRSARDTDGNGMPDSTRTYEYRDGGLSRVVADEDADGMVDRIEHYTSEPTQGWARPFD